jgi:spectinomycin phosphotransferase
MMRPIAATVVDLRYIGCRRTYRGLVFTPPDDLPETALRAALADHWSLGDTELEYRPVGFGSHHWEIVGDRRFVTVDDLRTRRWTTDEPLTESFRRLHAALAATLTLRAAGRDFVVAPVPAGDGSPAVPLGDSFAVAVYPWVTGESLDWDSYTSDLRLSVLEMLISVHTAPPGQALPDDYVIQLRDFLTSPVHPAETGPYARRAADLIVARSDGVARALARYDALVAAVRADPPALVLTHGEPHPGNVMRTGTGDLKFIDWDTARLAPPERDLWDLDPGDGSLHAAYTAATGWVPRPEILDLYRLRWDLTEIALCLARFREPHGATADDEETWTNLEESLAAVSP